MGKARAVEAPHVTRPVGRPRRLDDEAERRLILDAAYRVMRDGIDGFTVNAVLAEAGLSTRAFYRHFDSKEALHGAMYLRDGKWAADRLDRRLAAETNPIDAVVAWIDEIYEFTRDRRRAERVRVVGVLSPARTALAGEVEAEALVLLTRSLHTAIAAGVADGSFVVTDPHSATRLVAAVTTHGANVLASLGNPGVDQVATTEFCLAALGARRAT